jgi:ketosteroid isomerase-like protein
MDCDARAISGLYAEDATVVHSAGPLCGRPSIEEAYAELYERFSAGPLCGRASIEEAYAELYERFSPRPSKLEHVVAIGGDMMLRAGSWSHTYRGPAGLVHQWGSWTTTDVLRGNTWQIHTETIFTHCG